MNCTMKGAMRAAPVAACLWAVATTGGLAQARGDLLDVVMRDLALCAEIVDSASRLACYDKVADRTTHTGPRSVDPADKAYTPGGQQPPAPGNSYVPPPQGGYVPPSQGGYVPPPQGGYVPPQRGGPTQIVPGQQGYVPPPMVPPPPSQYQPGDPRPLMPPGGTALPPNQPRDIGPPPGAGQQGGQQDPDRAFVPGQQPPPAPQQRSAAPPQYPPGTLPPPVTLAIRQLRDRDYKWEVEIEVTNNTNRTIGTATVACVLSVGQQRVGEYNAVARQIPPGATVQTIAVGPETSRAYVDNATCRVISPVP